MTLPVTVLMITLNEAHNMRAVLENLEGFAAHVRIVDSYSKDDTVGIALEHGAEVVQRRFRGFGDQWNFALTHWPAATPWTMKLDPDERLTDALKAEIARRIEDADGWEITRRLWFMGRPLPIRQPVLRLWRTGSCRFSDVLVNEYPQVEGRIARFDGEMEHHDSPNLHHWFDKQNKYMTDEALTRIRGAALAEEPRLFGTRLQRWMWLKRHFWAFPGRYTILWLYHMIWLGAWRAGRTGRIWAHLRTELYRTQDYKVLEMQMAGSEYTVPPAGPGAPDPRVPQAD